MLVLSTLYFAQHTPKLLRPTDIGNLNLPSLLGFGPFRNVGERPLHSSERRFGSSDGQGPVYGLALDINGNRSVP